METTPTLGQQLAALRRPREARCQRCGKPFTTIGPRRYCSATCRTGAYRERKRNPKPSPAHD